MPDIRRVRIDSLVLHGVSAAQRDAVIRGVRSAVAEAVAATPTAPRNAAALSPAIGNAIATRIKPPGQRGGS